MSTELIVLIAVSAFAVFNIAFYLFMIVYASYQVYTQTLKRRSKDQWGRSISEYSDYQIKMDEEGMSWHYEHQSRKKDVHIVNKGLNLYGEYYDFGSDKAVMILSGRTESLRYGYYFAKPYSDSGFNVLVVDPRAHGLSDGLYNTVGFEESGDALEWARFLEREMGVKTVVFHGICIGAAGGMLGITSPDCPDCVKGLVTEGMFANFGESMKNHLIEKKRNWFPIRQCIDFWMKRYTGHSMMKGPIDYIPKMNKPLLMIQSKMDIYSTPENAKKLFDACPSEHKSIVWYDKGGHSQLRLTDTEKYDNAVKEFLNKYFI